MDKELFTKAEKGRKLVATFTAKVVWNAMEDFRIKYLSNEQMKELNPIIRNAIYTTMYAFDHMHEFEKAMQFLEHQNSLNSEDWEEPMLTVDFEDEAEKVASVPQKHAGRWASKNRQGNK